MEGLLWIYYEEKSKIASTILPFMWTRLTHGKIKVGYESTKLDLRIQTELLKVLPVWTLTELAKSLLFPTCKVKKANGSLPHRNAMKVTVAETE